MQSESYRIRVMQSHQTLSAVFDCPRAHEARTRHTMPCMEEHALYGGPAGMHRS
jgi:hypothetical protein